MSNSNKNKVCVYLSNKSKTLIDSNIKHSGAHNRSDFIDQAIECYCAVLNQENTTKVLTPALESVIRASIQNTENHLARILFKESVSIAMMMHVMAIVFELDSSRIDEIRGTCIQEIKRLNGKFKFEDAIDYEG